MDCATMLKTFTKYLRWSNISLTVEINPFGWRFDYSHLHNPNGYDPKLHSIIIRFLMFKLHIIIDDGSW